MSLRIWLPLNEDLKNQGMDNITITNNEIIIDNNGKIGRCIKTISNIDLKTNFDFNIQSLSFGGWFKIKHSDFESIFNNNNNNKYTGNLIGNSNYGGIGIIWNSMSSSDIKILANLKTPTITLTTQNYSIDFDKWIHIFLIWDCESHTLKLYKDGFLLDYIQTNNFSDGRISSLKLNYKAIYEGIDKFSLNIPIYFNDIRVYDNTLSLKQIKEISKGLVLHYPFNEINFNLNQIENTSGYTNIGIPSGIITYQLNTPRYNNATFFDGNKSYYQLSKPMYNLYNQDFTISVWLKPQNKARGVIISEYSAIGASNVALQLININQLRIYWNGSPDIRGPAITENEWNHCVIVKTDNDMKFYINGKLEYTYNQINEWSQRTSSALPRIGDDYRGNSANTVSYKGGMSDFRFYATALSKNDIKELYKTTVSFDKNNNCYTNYYEEIKQQKINIEKKKIINSFKLEEKDNNKISILKNGTIYSNSFIEN